MGTDRGLIRSAPGDIDIGEEPKETEYCLMKAGWAFAYTELPNGRRQVLDLILPGDEFSLYCQKSGVELRIGALTPVEWCRGRAEVGLVAFDKLASYRKEMQDRLVMQVVRLGRMTALQATCSLLVEIVDRLAAAGQTRSDRLDFPVPQSILADMLGLSAVHMSRQLSELKGQNLLIKTRDCLMVEDLIRMRAIAACHF